MEDSSLPIRKCSECRHYEYHYISASAHCMMGHNPVFHEARQGVDIVYGHYRRCADFLAKRKTA